MFVTLCHPHTHLRFSLACFNCHILPGSRKTPLPVFPNPAMIFKSLSVWRTTLFSTKCQGLDFDKLLFQVSLKLTENCDWERKRAQTLSSMLRGERIHKTVCFENAVERFWFQVYSQHDENSFNFFPTKPRREKTFNSLMLFAFHSIRFPLSFRYFKKFFSNKFWILSLFAPEN